MTKIFAHRGASGYAPENTMEAFVLAIEQGADGIELDVQMTKDGHVVVVHDETIDRVSNGKGPVASYTLEELKKFSFSNHMEKYKTATIPTLKEVLDVVKKSDIQLNIELKTGIYWYPELEEKTVQLVKEAEMQDRVVYSSFNHYSIKKIQKLDPRAECAFLYSDVILDVDKYAKNAGVCGIHPAIYHVKMDNFLKEYQQSGLKVRVWTVNRKEDMKWLIDEGVEAIITNYPDLALRL